MDPEPPRPNSATRSPALRSRVGIVFLVLGAVLLAVGAGILTFGGQLPTWTRAPSKEAPDIVLILANGLRADIPGEDAAEAAFLEAAGIDDGLRFRTAWVQSVQPYVAMGTLLTGFYPSAIPLCSPPQDNSGVAPWCVEPPPDRRTLPEVLGLYGYRTALLEVTSPNPRLEGTSGPAKWRGFEKHLQEMDQRRGAHPYDVLAGAARSWWAQDSSRPRFLMVSVGMGSDALTTRLDDIRRGATFPEADRPAFLAANPALERRLHPGMPWPYVTEATVQEVRTLYQGAATECGADLKQLLAGLSPGPRPTYTIVSSLYGLSFGEISGTPTPEQAEAGSHQLLVDRTLRVPLVISGPGEDTIDDPVELIDLMPTLAGLARAVHPAGLPGRDLLALPATPEPNRIIYAEYGDMMTVRSRRDMLIFRSQIHGSTSLDPEFTQRLIDARLAGSGPLFPAMTAPGSGQPESANREFFLYNIEDDPLQTREITAAATESPFLELYTALVAFRTGPAALPPEWLDREHVQALRRRGVTHYW